MPLRGKDDEEMKDAESSMIKLHATKLVNQENVDI
jgi:hypothetical protein